MGRKKSVPLRIGASPRQYTRCRSIVARSTSLMSRGSKSLQDSAARQSGPQRNLSRRREGQRASRGSSALNRPRCARRVVTTRQNCSMARSSDMEAARPMSKDLRNAASNHPRPWMRAPVERCLKTAAIVHSWGPPSLSSPYPKLIGCRCFAIRARTTRIGCASKSGVVRSQEKGTAAGRRRRHAQECANHPRYLCPKGLRSSPMRILRALLSRKSSS